MNDWKLRKRPARLERRIEFDDYEQTREFLERAAELAEREGYYPDLSFGRTHVNLTLQPQNDADEIGEPLMQYAREVDALLPERQVN
ncbi:pterin-4-alpha-carbinolamine dehydratase [Candidatus Tenderia electrophaga]|uniref:4a-hydroxytetrahydrobiopterin dehydratase n=1 Tax=Candidatus Tenderia electrophaga TaxID=1748243 RepID=A0A0S2THU4_9GAMM|nr:pterin-4-alpha-carbinolamine dehydratase [Candidatus Tenderia electrophaga]